MAINCVDSLSSFVNKSETLCFPAMCSTCCIKEFCTFFADCIFSNLDISEAFGRHIVRPLDGGSIVVVDSDGAVGEFVEDTKIEESFCNILELLGALVD